jgi:SpoVK/Ycf46/Vps4 family AAA+-type ATPase
MKSNGQLISEQRQYLVLNVQQARQIVKEWLAEIQLENVVKFGLPEIDDRYHIWRVPIRVENGKKIGEVVIDAYSTEIIAAKTTKPEILTARLLKQDETKIAPKKQKRLSALQFEKYRWVR